jgi:hypothetical protein
MIPSASPPQLAERDPAPELSKRAARRLIQRALVLMARDKHIRQHIREVEVVSLWTLGDWDFIWTVILDRGKIEFERRPAKRPDLALAWKSAGDFWEQVETGSASEGGVEYGGKPELRHFGEEFLKWFLVSLRHVFHNPVDDVGENLL